MSTTSPTAERPLQDRVIVVTGGAVHLGASYSRHLAARGAHVVIADLADTAPLTAELQAAGHSASGHQTDVTESESLAGLVEATLERFERIDGLVNNAGYFRNAFRGPVDDISETEWDRCFDVNVKGIWKAVNAVLPTFRAASYGKIVNVSSATAFKGLSEMSHYVASKAAVTGLARALAVELAPFNICVNSIAPDYVPDEYMHQRRPAAADRAMASRHIQREQKPEDLIGAVAYLCSPESDFVTGQTIHVNGGSYLT